MLTDNELKAGFVAILVYHTYKQNPEKLPYISCTIDNLAAEKTMEICSQIDLEKASQVISNIIKNFGTQNAPGTEGDDISGS